MFQQIIENKEKPKEKAKLPSYNISPGIIREFRIYNISSKSPVIAPYSRETEWQQILQVYFQKLNMASFQQNIGGLTIAGLKNKKPAELQQHLEQNLVHREIELMVKVLNLRNRNWLQEQIKMSRRLAGMETGSFAGLVVTREYLQLKEHFNWFTWAVAFYYFHSNKIERFFQYVAHLTKKDEGEPLGSGRDKQQNMIHQEINHLFNQLKNLKTKLPSPISRKWTEGFSFQGVFFRMLPQSDCYFVKNEMKALKYIQTELLELTQIHNSLREKSPHRNNDQSIYKQLILPLLYSVDCGGFMMFASPTIYIPDYSENQGVQQTPRKTVFQQPADNINFTTKYRERRSLTTIYGRNVYMNQKQLSKLSKQSQNETPFSFLQENIEEIDDQMLNMMPLLKNITKQNVVPIMDFEDNTQAELNFLVLHVSDCIPTVKVNENVSMIIPCDQSEEINYINIKDTKEVQVKQIKSFLSQKEFSKHNDTPFKMGKTYKNQKKKEEYDSDFEEEDFETDIQDMLCSKSFCKHGYDILLLFNKQINSKVGSRIESNQLGQLSNKRAQSLYCAREQDTSYTGLTMANSSQFVYSLSQIELSSRGKTPQVNKPLKKQSILRKNIHTNMDSFSQFGMYAQDAIGQGDNEVQISGNVVAVSEHSRCAFKLKYALINHRFNSSIENIFLETVCQIAEIIENTDTINNIQSLKELLHRKGLNLRFEWLLMAKLKTVFHRDLVMMHILIRTIKKILHEEIKLKSQVPTPIKPKTPIQPAKSLAEHQQSMGTRTIEQVGDHFMGNQQDTFKDNLVFITNTLLRRKFSKQKHVFDETLIGLFLNRLKIVPMIQEMLSYVENVGSQLLSTDECNYIFSKTILEDIISSPSRNPALYLNSVQTYFHVDIDQEFMRKCRQDKFSFLSQLTSQPMGMNNLQDVNLNCTSYFSIKEFSYLMLANLIYKKHAEATNKQVLSQMGINQTLKHNVFRNQHSQKSRPADLDFLSDSMSSFKAPHKTNLVQNARNTFNNDSLNQSITTDKNPFLSRQSERNAQIHQTPRQFNNIDNNEFRDEVFHAQPEVQHQDKKSELIMPSILYKLDTNKGQQHLSTSNLLPFYVMPNKDIFNTWVMYLEQILKEVFALQGSEQILLEALNLQGINIYFAEMTASDYFPGMQSPLLSPTSAGLSQRNLGEVGSFDRDSFMKVCIKIKDIQASTSNCAPEVLAMSEVVCGLNYEQAQDDVTFPIESEKSYLTALTCLFHLIGDPRGRGNLSVACMLLITWKLSLLSLCTENRKVHDSEFSEELFDATLTNLMNHKTAFRTHQNNKLARVEQNQRSSTYREQPMALQRQKSQPNIAKRQETSFQLLDFELKMDQEIKTKNQFQINTFTQSKKASIPATQTAGQQSINISKSYQGMSMVFNQDRSAKPERLSHLQANQADLSDVELAFTEETAPETKSEYIKLNFFDPNPTIPEIPFTHWSIYRQGIQNLVTQQGHKFRKNTKQLNKFLSQMYKNVLSTAIDKQVLFNWLVKYNVVMYQSGLIWRNNQIKQAVFFQSAQMISSRSSSRSFNKGDAESALGLSVQGSVISQGGPRGYRSPKTQHLGSYSSIINTDNGSINKGDIHGVLYSWGADTQGQLGLDSYAHLSGKPATQKVNYPRIISVLKDEFIKEVCCGYQHTLAITIHGNVYSWGNNESCQLGLGPKAPEHVRKPKLIEGLKNIVKISAGNEHTAAINKNQELFTWGAQSQTGQNDVLPRDVPSKVEFFKHTKIQQVACGGLHTLAITKDNKVFCWGSTEGGQLGLPLGLVQKLCRTEENAVKQPQLLACLQDQIVTQVACGETHSLCLTKNGAIFGWGMSLYGQLGLGFSADSFEPGLGMEKSKVMEPRKIDTLNDEEIKKIYCGSTFSLFLTNKGELYGCGMNDLGQLGEDIYNDLSVLENAQRGKMQTSDITIPTYVSSLQGISINTIACGEAHVLAIDEDEKSTKNMLWAWGQFKSGQLGLGEVTTKLNPRPVQNLSAGTINKIDCGSAHSIALIGDASNVTTLSPNYYAANEVLTNQWNSGMK